LARYPLDTLITVRDRAVQLAAKELRAAKDRLAEAKAIERRAAEALARWRERMEAETERRWASLLGARTTKSGLEAFREGLASLRQREADLAEELERAARAAMECLSEEERASLELSARTKAREKLERHRNVWLEAEALEQERLEGLEMEEFTRPSIEATD
jgi:hypothetical protein